MASWLRDEVRRSFAPPWHAMVERNVFGALDADEIVDALDVACRSTLGAALRDGFLYEVSVGVVIGCHLTDGRDVVVKGYQPRWTPGFLAAVKQVQTALHAQGYPCPRPLDADLQVGDATMLVESVLPDPGTSPSTEATRDSLATGLADLVERCRALDEPSLAPHPMRVPFDGPFPEPHSPIFDFDTTRDGAGWIEEIAVHARRLVEEDPSEPLIAHTDWSSRNVRVDEHEPIAVYDWDSLAIVRESEAVAIGATTWCKSGRSNDPTPDASDIEQYLAAYEARRGEPFTTTQRRSYRAATVATMAYTARCEHAIDPHEQTWTTTRPRLREAAALL
ncbi:MAG: hypothetical protein QOD30_1154 [Actinomycetota bacterium]|nr:hypothetical protein [Actinomycetota bacterium]